MECRGGRQPWLSWELKEGLTNQKGDFHAEGKNKEETRLGSRIP